MTGAAIVSAPHPVTPEGTQWSPGMLRAGPA